MCYVCCLLSRAGSCASASRAVVDVLVIWCLVCAVLGAWCFPTCKHYLWLVCVVSLWVRPFMSQSFCHALRCALCTAARPCIPCAVCVYHCDGDVSFFVRFGSCRCRVLDRSICTFLFSTTNLLRLLFALAINRLRHIYNIYVRSQVSVVKT
jgi:hypothetical protein